LPYRPAAQADLIAVAAALAQLRARGADEGDDVVVELRNLEQLLEILLTPSGA